MISVVNTPVGTVVRATVAQVARTIRPERIQAPGRLYSYSTVDRRMPVGYRSVSILEPSSLYTIHNILLEPLGKNWFIKQFEQLVRAVPSTGHYEKLYDGVCYMACRYKRDTNREFQYFIEDDFQIILVDTRRIRAVVSENRNHVLVGALFDEGNSIRKFDK